MKKCDACTLFTASQRNFWNQKELAGFFVTAYYVK